MNDRTIEPQRLDVVLADSVLQSGDIPAYIQEFEALLRTRRRGLFRGFSPSLHDVIVDTVMPRISDPSIFQGSRFTMILEGLARDLAPLMGDDSSVPEIRSIVQEELVRYWAVQDRRRQGMPS